MAVSRNVDLVWMLVDDKSDVFGESIVSVGDHAIGPAAPVLHLVHTRVSGVRRGLQLLVDSNKIYYPNYCLDLNL